MGIITFRVVAIHGLGGHPMKTWSKEHKLWLRDLLPGHLPSHNLRISSFGYNSAVFGRSRSQIRHFAEQLLNDLHQRRRETKTTGIPIVFVCHSLGGIVCKKALNIAHEHARVHRDITQSTKGIVFMGTPHLGADVAAWGRFFGNIGNVVTFGSFRTDLLKDLKSKSREFGDIATSFVERAADLQIVSMFERRPTKGILVPSG
ncbi:hypothetical protein K440DRAFT_573639 [Wilcoxina mikolae CBS 423.85]|nr:hypothetical protein K440DRAFT_573639 [Wilcoxina mikolae CBS 423.85]